MKLKILVINIFLTSATILNATQYSSQTIGGGTGIITTESAKIAAPDSFFGIDFAHHTIFDHNNVYNIPKVLVSIAGEMEIGAAYDFQPYSRNNDFLSNAKYRLYSGKTTSIAAGGNFQYLMINREKSRAGQVYTAITYNGDFFSMPAETTMLIGKTFSRSPVGTDFDFSMGFDVDMLANIFGGRFHWITDFSNYAYSVHAGGMFPERRGIFNTGARFIIVNSGGIRLNIDALFLDFLDEKTRSISIGANFSATF